MLFRSGIRLSVVSGHQLRWVAVAASSRIGRRSHRSHHSILAVKIAIHISALQHRPQRMQLHCKIGCNGRNTAFQPAGTPLLCHRSIAPSNPITIIWRFQHLCHVQRLPWAVPAPPPSHRSTVIRRLQHPPRLCSIYTCRSQQCVAPIQATDLGGSCYL